MIPNKKLSSIVDDFFAHEFCGHDIARHVEGETVAMGCAELRMSGDAPRNCDGIAPFLPPHWRCHIDPYSDIHHGSTGTRKVLWISIPVDISARYPLHTELAYAILLLLAIIILLATIIYRYLYIY